jgi:serine/threonine protein phosphatase PrpC
VRLVAGFASHRGLVRQINEDSFLVRRSLYAVCDGMGGARAGEVASQMACERLVAINPREAGRDELREAIVEANGSIAARSLADPQLLGMGTTLTSALIHDDSVILGHVGDSRAYLLHDGDLRQLTEDHSWVGEMVRRGELTPAEAAVHPHRSVITKALGTDEEADPDIFEARMEAGDRLLLCSDGLSGMVSDDAIAQILRDSEGPQAAADALVAAALAGGGEDNITVVVVESVEEEDAGGEGEESRDDAVTFGPADRGEERASSVPGFMRPALGVGARLRRPPIWTRQAQEAPAGAGSSLWLSPLSLSPSSSAALPSSTRTCITWAPRTVLSRSTKACRPRSSASISLPWRNWGR